MRQILGILGLALIAAPAFAQEPTPTPAPPARPPLGWVGITYSVSGVTDREGNLQFGDYPVVVSVDPGSPAARAGVAAGDTIVSFNNRDIRKYPLPLRSMLQPGKTFVLRAKRGSRERLANIVVAERPRNRPEQVSISIQGEVERGVGGGVTPAIAPDVYVQAPPSPVAAILRVPIPGMPMIFSEANTVFAGAEVRRMNRDLADVLGVKDAGLIVVSVADASPAQESGLRGGDVILRADNVAVLVPMDLARILRDLRESEEHVVRLDVVRKKKAQTISLRW